VRRRRRGGRGGGHGQQADQGGQGGSTLSGRAAAHRDSSAQWLQDEVITLAEEFTQVKTVSTCREG
ncbi:hypothetical protein, partial [Streptomyces sp. NPDC000188]|uniref:hypothetical protein n=1 Tax=Streptomyces sp. NPDC000188 TaxID=3154245 RepID=UPI003333DF4D